MSPFVRAAMSCAIASVFSLSHAASGVSGGVVKIGILTDMSGPYSDNLGPGAVLATQMAIDDFGGKVLGAPVSLVVADHQNKADIGATKAREWMDRGEVDVVTEMVSSSVALAVSRLATEKKRIAIVTGAGAASITNEQCGPLTFQWAYDTYALANVASKALVADGNKTWSFITADYAFGHALESDGAKVVKDAGGSVMGTIRYPFPGSDFSSYLVKAQSTGASVVALANAGADAQTAIKQAIEFGLTRKQKVVAMLMSITDLHSVGLQAAQGMYYAESWYWDLNDETRKFARRFMEKRKRMPTALQAAQYSATLSYLKAVQAAGTDESSAVAGKLRSLPVNDIFATNGVVRGDGKMVHDMYLVQVKTPAESKYPWDYYRVVKTVKGADAFLPLSESRCALVKH